MLAAGYFELLRLLKPCSDQLMPFAKWQFARCADGRERRGLNTLRLFLRKSAPEFLNRGHLNLEKCARIRPSCFQRPPHRAVEFHTITCTAHEVEKNIDRFQVVARLVLRNRWRQSRTETHSARDHADQRGFEERQRTDHSRLFERDHHSNNAAIRM